MTPIHQTEQGPGAGDCFRACVASLLDMPRAKVPHFFAGLDDGEPMPPRAEDRMQEWFHGHGLALIHAAFQSNRAEGVMQAFSARHPGLHYILCGKSAKGRDHAVVVRDGKIVHDPARVSLGLHGPQDDGCYHVFLMGKRV